jgi:hypothetical protein
VGLHVTDNDIDASIPQAIAFHQHGVGLSHSRGGAQINLKLSPRLLLNQVKKVFRALTILN